MKRKAEVGLGARCRISNARRDAGCMRGTRQNNCQEGKSELAEGRLAVPPLAHSQDGVRHALKFGFWVWVGVVLSQAKSVVIAGARVTDCGMYTAKIP